MALLHALHSLAPANDWRLVVAHFNHQLRGKASDGDARFVAARTAKLGLICVTEKGDVRGEARKHGWSIEMAARALRHAFLARTARRLGLGFVALAHHADDQVELFFLRLLRGAGGGLAGMKWRNVSPADASVTLIRPLLDQTKVALLGFVHDERVRFREDVTNTSNDILRNRIRRELLPRLRKRFQPALDRTVLRAMEIVGAESEFAQTTAQAMWRGGILSRPFARLPLAVQRQCVCLELARLGFAPDFELVEQLRLRPGVRHSWQDGWLTRAGTTGRVTFERIAKGESGSGEVALDLTRLRGASALAGVEVRWRKQPHRRHGAAFGTMPRRERFDADLVGSRIVLRHWRPGDRFQPIGMPRPVKLQDLFTNAKVPASERHRRLVAEAADGRIFWVEGLRIAEPFKLTPVTRTELVWRWSPPAV